MIKCWMCNNPIYDVNNNEGLCVLCNTHSSYCSQCGNPVSSLFLDNNGCCSNCKPISIKLDKAKESKGKKI